MGIDSKFDFAIKISAMNDFVKPDKALLLNAERFNPDCAESSWTLPGDWYYRSEIYARECERIFSRHWIYLGHESDITSTPKTEIVNGRHFEILRGLDGRPRATNTDNQNPALLEVMAGFVFINLDINATALSEQIGGFVDDIKDCCPRVEDLIPVKRIEREIQANWKTVIDNNHECYHCALNHKSLMKLVDYENEADWKDDGITFSHRVKRKNLENPAYALKPGEIRQDSLFGYVWPNLIPLWFPGTPSAVMFQVIPTGPESCIARHDFYFLRQQLSRQEKDFIDYIDQVLVPEDLGLCESVQKGLHSMGYHQGKFVVDYRHPEFSEHHVHFFQQMLFKSLTE
ncbi:MAG: SRPBCC family protein [Pseudomonadota bacterium]